MTSDTIGSSQRAAAKVVGLLYLLAMALSMFAEGYVGRRLIVPRNAVETAHNVMAHEFLFRTGIASSLLVVVSDVALIVALYVILKSVNEHLALSAAFLRLIETALYAAATLNYLDVLRMLGSDGPAQALSTGQLQAMARLSISAYNAGLGVSFVFLGIGSAIFGYLWLKSDYVPRFLAAFAILAPLLLTAGSLTFVLFPKQWAVVFPGYMVPMFFFEVGMAMWLLARGLREPRWPALMQARAVSVPIPG